MAARAALTTTSPSKAMATIRETAAALIAEGLQVVPIVRGSKAPDIDGWQQKTFTLDDFTEEHNIGVKLINGVVDIDMDCPEAAKCAAQLMPVTRRHGRASNPGSHYWYRCADISAPTTFKDIDGKGLMEIRASRPEKPLQTVVPPSIHTTGEQIVIEHDRGLLEIAVNDLLIATKATAVATLLSRHWPTGARHVAAGHVAGTLLRCGFDAMWTERIVRTAALVGGDEEYNDRARVARDTAAKFDRDEKVTGAPSLRKSFEDGDKILGIVYRWMGREGMDDLDKLNERFFVAMYGSKAAVVQERTEGTLSFYSFGDFREKYYNRKVGKQRLGEWWLGHPDQRRYEEVLFAPPPRTCPEDSYNAWRGFSVEPDPNPEPELRCARFLDHLLRVVCMGNKGYLAYLLDWMAITVQRPGIPIGVAVVMRGESGAGKGSVAELFGSLFGPHYVQISSQQQITGRFNAALARRVVVFADEAIWAGSKADAGNLKRLVTERTLMVEPKFRDAVSEANCVHLIMATNEAWVWPATFKERRGFILDVELLEHCNEAYFNAIHDEWAAGGNAAFLALMLAREVPRRMGPVPQTDGLIEQQELSMDPVAEWWLHCLQNGEFETGQGWPPFVANRQLFDIYVASQADLGGRSRRSTETSLGKQIVRYLPGKAPLKRFMVRMNLAKYGPPRYEEVRVLGREMPAIDAARLHFDRLTGVRREWPVADSGARDQKRLKDDDDTDI